MDRASRRLPLLPVKPVTAPPGPQGSAGNAVDVASCFPAEIIVGDAPITSLRVESTFTGEHDSVSSFTQILASPQGGQVAPATAVTMLDGGHGSANSVCPV